MIRTRTTPAENPANWPAALHDELPRLRAHLVPLRDVVGSGITGWAYNGGGALTNWRLRRTARHESVAD